jgi:NAD(P)-dependent dehydrogenase (short-subunit alcohol dehydrogenase family)
LTGVLDGKTALVTGGTRGIGRAIAQRLAASGALVAINYASNAQGAEDAVAAIESSGGRAFAIRAELGTEGSIDELLGVLDGELKDRTGEAGLDILVNNIGGGIPGRVADTTTDILDRAYAINVRMPFLLTQALLPRLRDDGRVVNISSATVRIGFEDAAAYVMSKAALDMFSRLLAKGLGARGITVNSVGVGRTAGETNDRFFADPKNVKETVDSTAMRRVGTGADIAGVVHALVSPDGGWITGQVIDATGGFQL